MGMFSWLGIVGKLEAIIADAKAAEQTPAGTKLIVDVEAAIEEVKAANALPPPPEPPAAPGA
jgi:hypothetical protein